MLRHLPPLPAPLPPHTHPTVRVVKVLKLGTLRKKKGKKKEKKTAHVNTHKKRIRWKKTWRQGQFGGEAWGSGNQSTKCNYFLPSPSPRRNDLPKSSLSSVSTKSLLLVVFWGFSAADVFDDESQTLDLVLMMVSFGTLCFLFQIVGTQTSVSS